jgi:hypothetical protein
MTIRHIIRSTATGLLLLLAAGLQAQVLQQMQQQFPGQLAAFTKCNKLVNIKFSSGKLVAESEEENEMIILDDRAQGSYNRYSTYHGSFDELKELEAYTSIPDGNKYKKVKVTEFKTQHSPSNGIFYDDVKETSFDFARLTTGALCNVRIKELLTDIHLLTGYHFYTYLPTARFSYTVACPQNIDFRFMLKNNKDSIVQVNTYKKGKTNYYEFTASNIKLKERYSSAPSMRYYEPHVIVYVAGYTDDDGVYHNVLSRLDDLYAWNYDFIRNVNTTPSDVLTHLADSLTKSATTPMEKARKIYGWVQQHIKYVAFEQGLEGFIPRQAADVCTKRYGDCKDMSSLITALLKLSGVEAYYTWIGTRSIPYRYDEVFLPITDNHMISTARIDGKWYFLDGTDPNCIFGLPSSHIQGKQALLAISDKEYKILDVPVPETAASIAEDSTFIAFENDGIKGRMQVAYSGYFGIDLMNSLLYKHGDDERDYVKYRMGKASNKFIMGNYSINKTDPDNKKVTIAADFEVPGYGKKIADEIYINLNLEKFYNGAVIDTARRKSPIENDFGYIIRQHTQLKIPEGYAVSYQPKDFSYSNDVFDFSIQYKQYGTSIIATQEIKVKPLYIYPTQFTDWNTAVQKLTTQYKEQVVLKKK